MRLQIFYWNTGYCQQYFENKNMLSDNEKLGIRDLLSRLEEDIVFSLADTATKKALALTSIDEAIDAIILHSETALWFLNRKKLTRAFLFQYLSAKGVPISGQSDKCTVIDRVLKLWNESETLPVMKNEESSATANNLFLSKDQEMGLKFTQWFYGILLCVSNGETDGPRIADQFWEDSRLKITLINTGYQDSKESVGSIEVENLYREVLIQHQFIFNPNLTGDGVKEKHNPYGLVVIAVCGTSFQHGNCSGIFEQAFGLMQDPSAEFRWRIKWTELRITQATVIRVPCVRDLPELLAVCDN